MSDPTHEWQPDNYGRCIYCARTEQEHATTKAAARADTIMRNDYPIYAAFFKKHAFGSLMAPSCLCCGHAKPFAITHGELPNIGICFECRDARDLRASARADGAREERERCAVHAEGHGNVVAGPHSADYYAGFNANAKHIAAAIRALPASPHPAPIGSDSTDPQP